MVGWAADALGSLVFPGDLQSPDSSPEVISEIQHGIATGLGASGLKETFAHTDGTTVGVYVNMIPVMANVSLGGPEKFLLYVKELEDESGYTATITQRHRELSKELPPLDG